MILTHIRIDRHTKNIYNHGGRAAWEGQGGKICFGLKTLTQLTYLNIYLWFFSLVGAHIGHASDWASLLLLYYSALFLLL